MTFFSILETLLLGPVKLLLEVVFQIADRMTGSHVLAIVVLSAVVNILVLPLYRRADVLQEQVRDKERKMQRGIAHIRKAFTGETRTMLLHTYYRQNHYTPAYALKGSAALLLEIPFFIAAYRFLSGLEIFSGASFGPIADLSAPDGMLRLGGMSVNVLPLVMTAVNVASSAIYLKGTPVKTKLQVYATALFFLILLYPSPACLVLYWTLNNLFSLGKNIFYKLPHREKAGRIPWAAVLQKKQKSQTQAQPNPGNFVLCALFMTVLVGLLIPTTFLAASPQEYVDLSYFQNPLQYLISTMSMSIGTFFVWMGVFYLLASPRGKVFFERMLWIVCGIMLVNYMFFGTKLGVLSANLQYTSGMRFSVWEQIGNVVLIAAAGAALYNACVKWSKAIPYVLLSGAVALGCMSFTHVMKVSAVVEKTNVQQDTGEMASIRLDKSGKNVMVIMLDRAMGEMLPYLFNEKPELQEKFAGFTYYSNVISFGGCTNLSSPSLFGGYEYTPVEMNRRNEEPLVTKHNEAIKVMPTIFTNAGFDVTICDPVYANYFTIPDLSVFDDLPQAEVYITEGRFTDMEERIIAVENNHRNFFCFSLMKTMPVCLQPVIYNGGHYNQSKTRMEDGAVNYTNQKRQGTSVSEGMSLEFMKAYHVLDNLQHITTVTNEGADTYLSLVNETTHDPMLLQTPDYTPAQKVDNTAYDTEHSDRFVLDGRALPMEDEDDFIHYHANMAALLRLGEWFDYLRQQGVYDNTRILLVSDHAHPLYLLDELVLDDGDDLAKNVERYFPLMMVKDFGSDTFTTSGEFMTLADVPTLAMEGIIENPVNPFTGKTITTEEKNAHPQYITGSFDWDPEINNGNTFMPSSWLSVKDNIWEKSNWTYIEEMTVLSENAAP